MVLHRVVLDWTAMETQVRGDLDTGEKDLYCSPGTAHIHLLLDVLIRHGIIYALHINMVVILDGSHFPGCQLKWCSRKRRQELFLLGKTSCPAAILFLERLVVRGFQFLMDCFIQFHKGQKLAVTQGLQNPGRDHANEPFHKSLVLGTERIGRKNGGVVVLRHLLVGFVKHSLCTGVLRNTDLEVVQREDAGDAALLHLSVCPASCRQGSFARLEIATGTLSAAAWTALTASQVAVPEHGLMCRDRVAAAASSICDFPICGSQIFEPKDLFVIVHGKTP